MSSKIDSMDDPEEKLDLVDENDKPIGVIERKLILSILSGNEGFVRGVLIFLMNSSGELFITTRSQTKKIAPGGLDCSASGHVKHGHSYERAAVEELYEELGVSIEPGKLKYIGTVPPFQNVPYFHKLYVVKYDKTPQINIEDFSSANWLKPRDLDMILKSGAPVKDTLPLALMLLTEYTSGESSPRAK